MSLDPTSATRLEMAATDNGFDLGRGQDGEWLCFASSQAPLRIWLTALGGAGFALALSRPDVAAGLASLAVGFEGPHPEGAAGALRAGDPPTLHRLVRRAFQLARALPDEPLRAFVDATVRLPRTTEAERLVVQRIGQEIFRSRLLGYWEGRCAITGLGVSELLRASHIKPWAECESDAERLDVFNGILLAPQLDAAFDRGFLTIEEDGSLLVARSLDDGARLILGIERPLRVEGLDRRHHRYLAWHRDQVFRDRAHPSGR